MECSKCGEELNENNKCNHCDTSCEECCDGEDKNEEEYCGDDDCCSCDCQ